MGFSHQKPTREGEAGLKPIVSILYFSLNFFFTLTEDREKEPVAGYAPIKLPIMLVNPIAVIS